MNKIILAEWACYGIVIGIAYIFRKLNLTNWYVVVMFVAIIAGIGYFFRRNYYNKK